MSYVNGSNPNPVPAPTAFPIQFGQRDAKVIETATKASGTLSNKVLDATNSIVAIMGHIVPEVISGITGTSVAAIKVGDVCVQIKASDATAHWAPATVVATSPISLLPADLLIVFRVAS